MGPKHCDPVGADLSGKELFSGLLDTRNRFLEQFYASYSGASLFSAPTELGDRII